MALSNLLHTYLYSQEANLNLASRYLPVISRFDIVLGLVFLVLGYRIWLIVYRLCWHPLAGFPGPKIAAATFLYEFMWDHYGKGAYLFESERMHKKYGPIVRVTPEELSLHDPEFYDKLYIAGNTRRTNGFPHFAEGLEMTGSHALTADHDLHRLRKKPLEPYFSRQGIARIEPMLKGLVTTVVSRLQEFKGTGTAVRLDHVFSALAGDIILGICAGNTKESLLHDPSFSPQWSNLFRPIIISSGIFMTFPWVVKIAQWIPKQVLMTLNPNAQMLVNLRNMSIDQIMKAKQRQESRETILNQEQSIKDNFLFDQLLNSDMPKSELSVERLAAEAQVLMGAGTLTTSNSMSHLAFHILNNNQIHNKLREELKDVMSGFPETIPSWQTLEKLPYLQACVKEGLRRSYGFMHRLPRCSPDVALQYKKWTIPRGTAIGTSTYYMHTDPEVYPSPFEFRPERWLGDIDPRMRRNYVPFCKGSRGCLGINLAYAEIYLVMAALFCPRGPNLKLYETDETDAENIHAYLIPLPKLSTKGVRVLVE